MQEYIVKSGFFFEKTFYNEQMFITFASEIFLNHVTAS